MHLLHVGFGVVDKPDVKKLEKVFSRAESWARYAATCWILLTDESASDWVLHLENVIEEDKRHFLVYRLDPTDRQGWLSSDTWKWINEHDPEKIPSSTS